MTTIARIARREFTEMARDGRFRSTAMIIFALLLVSLLVGWKGYAEHRALQTAAQSRQREQWLNMIRMPPHLAAHSGTVIYKPRMPVSAIDRGIELYVGASVFLEAHKRNLFDHKPAEEAPSAQRLGEVTVGMTLQLLVPLLIILLTYAAFAGEREQGTLRQILGLGVSKRDLALGKALGAAGPLLLLLAPAAALGALAIALLDRTRMLLESAPRLALMSGLYLAYFAVFLCVGLIVSARSSNSRRALLWLLGFWFGVCLLLPRAAVEFGQRIYPAPTTREFTEELEKEKKTHPEFFARRGRVVERLKQGYGVTNDLELPVSPYGLTLYEAEEDETKTYERHFNRLFESYERQNRFYQAAAVMAPLIAVQSLSMGLAGSDWNYHSHFAEAAEQYRRVLVQTMNRGLIDKGAADQYTESGHELYEQVPPFSYTAPGISWILGKTKLSLIFLLLWLALVAVATPLALLKLRVD